ncbi:unnamed protein product [Brassica napus]|uniref:(rape) hypothetical protein n=1 Tax=Brassica napus TaxID=3708 RepID=A0A816JBG3_BRANA|nr:unnamed protein product [Brassica napus]
MAPESSRDETASNEKSRDGKGGEKSPAKPSDMTVIVYTKVYNVVYTRVYGINYSRTLECTP